MTTIVHIIYNLGRGGAETMLVQVLAQLKEYRNIVVTLSPKNHFETELQCEELICLNCPSLLSLPKAAYLFKKVLSKYQPAIVHSQLPQSNFVARLATPAHIPLLTTIQNSIAYSGDYKKLHIRMLDRLTYKFKRSTIIGVSENVLKDYFSVLKLKPVRTQLLYNPVDIKKYQSTSVQRTREVFSVVTVGALSYQKNISYLINAASHLKGEAIEIHVYGQGPLQQDLQSEIDKSGVKVILKGQATGIHTILPSYHLYVMSSLFEGLSLSVLEAMATKLPLLLSDIPSFREQCGDGAIYFDLKNPKDFADKLLLLKNKEQLRNELAQKAYESVLDKYTLTHHMSKLREIYQQTIEENAK